jgi:S-(hydroxymethyl)glutathione dehydrogenase/alcohol dehydrogenase
MKAAILTAHNAPLELQEIQWESLCYGQVLVKILSTGICGAQLSEIRGDKNPEAPLPRLLGHEAAVKVIECGPGVKTVKAGDKCVAHWRKGNGIESEHPRVNGKCVSPASTAFFTYGTTGLITTFATHSVISENRLTAVPSDTPDELCALLGCGLSTALGVMENEANLRIGESVLIIGCGGLGLNLILAAKIRGAGQIIVCDINKSKMSIAHSFGASFSCSETPIYGCRFDVIIDTSGNPSAISHGLSILAPSGRFIMVGQPKFGESISIPSARNMFNGIGKTIMATQGGRFSPSQDIPRYISAVRAGRLNLDGLVTHRLPLEKINDGLDLVRQGHAGRVMITCCE